MKYFLSVLLLFLGPKSKIQKFKYFLVRSKMILTRKKYFHFTMVFCCIVAWIQPDFFGCQQDFLVVSRWKFNKLRWQDFGLLPCFDIFYGISVPTSSCKRSSWTSPYKKWGKNSSQFCSYLWLAFKSGLYSRVDYNGAITILFGSSKNTLRYRPLRML